jgi:hypothetical protein
MLPHQLLLTCPKRLAINLDQMRQWSLAGRYLRER